MGKRVGQVPPGSRRAPKWACEKEFSQFPLCRLSHHRLWWNADLSSSASPLLQSLAFSWPNNPQTLILRILPGFHDEISAAASKRRPSPQSPNPTQPDRFSCAVRKTTPTLFLALNIRVLPSQGDRESPPPTALRQIYRSCSCRCADRPPASVRRRSASQFGRTR